MRKIPIIVFINKLDREGKDAFDLMDEVEKKLGLHVTPLSFPIGMGYDFKGIYNIWEQNINLFSSDSRKNIDDTIAFSDVSNPELDKIVQILVDNPNIKLELGSHTDSRATTEYNQKLSQRRADSAVSYIISKGIASNRIIAKGYGESQLVNQCADGITCTEEEHQLNRRTEFKVIGIQ